MRAQLEEQLKKPIPSPPAPQGEKAIPKEEPAPRPLPGGSLNVLLQLPFQFAGDRTGYYYQFSPKMQPMMEGLAEQVMEDFGPDVALKWLTLAVFCGCYGHCFLEFRQGLKEHAAKVLEAEKLRKINETQE